MLESQIKLYNFNKAKSALGKNKKQLQSIVNGNSDREQLSFRKAKAKVKVKAEVKVRAKVNAEAKIKAEVKIKAEAKIKMKVGNNYAE